jgi:hypothetical protein
VIWDYLHIRLHEALYERGHGIKGGGARGQE